MNDFIPIIWTALRQDTTWLTAQGVAAGNVHAEGGTLALDANKRPQKSIILKSIPGGLPHPEGSWGQQRMEVRCYGGDERWTRKLAQATLDWLRKYGYRYPVWSITPEGYGQPVREPDSGYWVAVIPAVVMMVEAQSA